MRRDRAELSSPDRSSRQLSPTGLAPSPPPSTPSSRSSRCARRRSRCRVRRAGGGAGRAAVPAQTTAAYRRSSAPCCWGSRPCSARPRALRRSATARFRTSARRSSSLVCSSSAREGIVELVAMSRRRPRSSPLAQNGNDSAEAASLGEVDQRLHREERADGHDERARRPPPGERARVAASRRPARAAVPPRAHVHRADDAEVVVEADRGRDHAHDRSARPSPRSYAAEKA